MDNRPCGVVVVFRFVDLDIEWLAEDGSWTRDHDAARKFTAAQFSEADELAKEVGGHAVPHRWEEERPEPTPMPLPRSFLRAEARSHRLFGYDPFED